MLCQKDITPKPLSMLCGPWSHSGCFAAGLWSHTLSSDGWVVQFSLALGHLWEMLRGNKEIGGVLPLLLPHTRDKKYKGLWKNTSWIYPARISHFNSPSSTLPLMGPAVNFCTAPALYSYFFSLFFLLLFTLFFLPPPRPAPPQSPAFSFAHQPLYFLFSCRLF